MEKLKKSLLDAAFYLLIIAMCVAFLVLMVVAFVKVSVYAAESFAAESTRVLIDPGHGGEDGGAVSNDGVMEKDINLSISTYLKNYLELSGCAVDMTRTYDTACGDTSLATLEERHRSDMTTRLAMYNDDYDLVISIHQNKFTQEQYSGAQIFYSANDERSQQLAECLRNAIVGFLQPTNERELKEAGTDIYLLNNSENPAVLAECGFLSNVEETAKLVTEEYQKQMAFSIYCGTMEYLALQS